MRVKVGKHAWQGVFEQAVEVHLVHIIFPDKVDYGLEFFLGRGRAALAVEHVACEKSQHERQCHCDGHPYRCFVQMLHYCVCSPVIAGALAFSILFKAWFWYRAFAGLQFCLVDVYVVASGASSGTCTHSTPARRKSSIPSVIR